MNNKLLPKYFNFATQLKAHINTGTFPVGSTLPSQRELAQQFGTTLMTIRKALTLLEGEGLIRTEHGVGTFVMNPHVQEEDFHLFSLSNEMKKDAALQTETRILSAEPTFHHLQAADTFNLSANTAVGLLERLRFLEGVPFMMQQSFLPPQFAHLVQRYASNQSLYDFIREETRQAVTMAKEVLRPILLTAVQANQLQAIPNSPAWLSIRLSSNQDGTPILYDEAILKQENFIVTMTHLGKRTECQLQMRHEASPDIFSYLKEE